MRHPFLRTLASTSAAPAELYIEDVFSTWLYTGNGSTQTITNQIDLGDQGGLTWIKGRSGSTGHRLTDTARGVTKSLESNSTAAEATESTGLTSFSSTGFSIGADADYNSNSATYVSWTFRKAAKFFDVVTYTGTGSNRTISHNLGSVPGCIIVKRRDTTGDWQVYHRSLANTEYLVLNTTATKATGATRWNSTTPTSSVFSLGTDATVNASGGTYVAYLFAHNAGGFGSSGNEDAISCGSFTTDGGGNATVSLGWEPQWVLIKESTAGASYGWIILDTMRGWLNTTSSSDRPIYANTQNGESIFGGGHPTATGFVSPTLVGSSTYVYIAIRRGPMKTPTDATKVFSSNLATGSANVTTGFPVDMGFSKPRLGTISMGGSRLTGFDFTLSMEAADAETTSYGDWASQVTNTTYRPSPSVTESKVNYAFGRAPKFLDVVAYTGTGSASTVAHNLGVAPELMIIKARSEFQDWAVYSAAIGSSGHLRLNSTAADGGSGSFFWNSTAPTATVFSVNTSFLVNRSFTRYTAYLFASCPGVSKVGSYTGTGTTLQVDCGFTAGARFVLIKRIDSTSNWFVWDTSRGIVSGNDPYLVLNASFAEVTNTDFIDPLNSGFEISSTASFINNSGGSYIYLAIA